MAKGGAAWYLERRRYDIPEVKRWCEENLTPKSWIVNEDMSMGMFEVCVGIEDEAMAFKLRWL